MIRNPSQRLTRLRCSRRLRPRAAWNAPIETLQDRLGQGVAPSRLRLHGGSANAFLPEFLADYNRRFAVPPQNLPGTPTATGAARRRLPRPHPEPPRHPESSAATSPCRYQNREYQILGQGHGYRLRGKPPSPCARSFDGRHLPVVPGQDPRLPHPRSKAKTPDPSQTTKRASTAPSTTARCASGPTPQVQTLPRSPLEPLGSPPPSPFHPYPMTARLVPL